MAPPVIQLWRNAAILEIVFNGRHRSGDWRLSCKICDWTIYVPKLNEDKGDYVSA